MSREINPALAKKLAPLREQTPRGERPVNRTSAGLRNALFDEIDALRRGEGDATRAIAVAQLAKGILSTAKLEYQFKQSGAGIAPVPLQLGDSSTDADGT